MKRFLRQVALYLIDGFFSCLVCVKLLKIHPTRTDFSNIQSLLICENAHLGDVVVATSILPLIKQRFPHIKIDFLVGSGSLPLLEGHPLVNAVYCVDHWLLNRSSLPLWKKIVLYLRQRTKVLKQLRSSRYDAALELHSFFPNSIFLLYQAHIPARVGYTKAGFAPLLTHPRKWRDKPQKIVDYHLELLAQLGIFPDATTPLYPSLPPLSSQATLALQLIPTAHYVIFHLCSTQEIREWPIEKWGQLLERFLAQGRTVVLTGQGKRQRELFAQLPLHPRVIDLSDRLNLHELMAVIQRAQLLVSVDSLPVHLASGYQIPTLILFAGRNRLEHWWPHNPHAHGLTHPMPCAPCFRGNGCASMDCIRKISVEQVMRASKI